MSRKPFQILCIVSVILFFLLVLFTLFIWFLVNVGGALFLAVMGHSSMEGMPLSEFLSNFIGSPMFYIFLADILAFIISVTGLTMTKKVPKKSESKGV